MSSVEQRYVIWRWKVTGKIPENGFLQDSYLFITRQDGSPTLLSLKWKNGSGEDCFINDVPLESEQPVNVMFGASESMPCCVNFKDSGDFLKGTFSGAPGGGDGNVGTFIAETHPGTTESTKDPG